MSATVIITAKAPAPTGVKTRLAPMLSGPEIVELQRAFIEDTVRLARSCRADVAIMCPPGDAAVLRGLLRESDVAIVEQNGHGLEAALEDAFERFTAGGRRAVALDSDSPHLRPAVLGMAIEGLGDADVAVGPTPDGGYYLVGATQSCRGLFASTGLGTGTALERLRHHCQARRMSVWSGPEEFDVDRPEDLAALVHVLRRDPSRAPSTAALLKQWPLWNADH